MAARAYFSHQALHGKKSSEMQEMLWQEHGINFNDYPARFKRGVYLRRVKSEHVLSAEQMSRIPEARRPEGGIVMKTEIVELDLPPILKIANKTAVLLDGAKPVLFAPEQVITETDEALPQALKR